MPTPQKFLQYSAGLFLLALTVIISAGGGVISLNVNLNLTLPPSFGSKTIREYPDYVPVPPPVQDHPQVLQNQQGDNLVYPLDDNKYRVFDWPPEVPDSSESQSERKGFPKRKPKKDGDLF
mgnify:CR=1 FL=1